MLSTSAVTLGVEMDSSRTRPSTAGNKRVDREASSRPTDAPPLTDTSADRGMSALAAAGHPHADIVTGSRATRQTALVEPLECRPVARPGWSAPPIDLTTRICRKQVLSLINEYHGVA
jgi:hypothetical protein